MEKKSGNADSAKNQHKESVGRVWGVSIPRSQSKCIDEPGYEIAGMGIHAEKYV